MKSCVLPNCIYLPSSRLLGSVVLPSEFSVVSVVLLACWLKVRAGKVKVKFDDILNVVYLYFFSPNSITECFYVLCA